MGNLEQPAEMKTSLIFLFFLLLAFSLAQYDDSFAKLSRGPGYCTATYKGCRVAVNNCNMRNGYIPDAYFIEGRCCCKCCKGKSKDCGPINCGIAPKSKK